MEAEGGGEGGELVLADAVVEGWAGGTFDLVPIEHDDFAGGAEEAGGLAKKCGLVVGFVEDREDEDALGDCVGQWDVGLLGVDGLDAGEAGFGGAAEADLEQRGLDIDGVDAASGADQSRRWQREEAGSGAEIDDGLTGYDAGGAEDGLRGHALVALLADEALGVGGIEVVGAVAVGDVAGALVSVLVG